MYGERVPAWRCSNCGQIMRRPTKREQQLIDINQTSMRYSSDDWQRAL